MNTSKVIGTDNQDVLASQGRTPEGGKAVIVSEAGSVAGATVRHTPLPWHFYDFMGDGIGYLRGPEDNEIAHHGDTCNSPEINKANAAFIVQAVNSFEAMREALKAMVDRWEPDCIGTDRRMYDNAVAALALAGAK